MGAIGILCVSIHDAVTKECVAPVSNNTFTEWDSTENVPSAILGYPRLCRPPGGSPFRTGHEATHGCCLLVEVHSVLHGHYELAAIELLSLDSDSPADFLCWSCLVVLGGC
jgi:hypothetical protein